MSQVKERAARAQPRVRQVKILRNEDKKGGDGVAASRGMAFVELDDHEHALCALRSLNNNPAPFGACPLFLATSAFSFAVYCCTTVVNMSSSVLVFAESRFTRCFVLINELSADRQGPAPSGGVCGRERARRENPGG